jgi:Na+/H+ antiporter NhaD/arsenite permease-like protein
LPLAVLTRVSDRLRRLPHPSPGLCVTALVTALVGALLAAVVAADPALAAEVAGAAGEEGHAAPHLEGERLTLWWDLPFVGILLSIAVFPLVAPMWWHRNFGKVSAFWGLAFLIPFALQFGWQLTLFEIVHVALAEYVPFIILLLALFTVAGGVRLKGSLRGTPTVNTTILAIGTVLASFMGTTGAAMLLIRPVLRANAWRKHQVHTVVFFIFLVANIGGSLTPLGDPPLFLGFLKGVDFFWPTTHMFLPMLIMAIPLLAIYFVFDTYLMRKEDAPEAPAEGEPGKKEPLALEGSYNLLLLLAVMGAVLLSGIWKPGIELIVYYVHWELQNIVRDALLLAIAYVSWTLTPKASREANGFTWFPILEVAKLFAGIFITIIPAIAMLRAGENGALAEVIRSVTKDGGEPIDYMYFWATGILSSFLDNAPTYLVFFNTAGGSPNVDKLMTDWSTTLLAISTGAVFMGAMTYIGNAPNFMVRSIAEERGVPMPSFFGYMLWSVVFLVPLFLVITVIFFAEGLF